MTQETPLPEDIKEMFGDIFNAPKKSEEEKEKEWLENKYPGLYKKIDKK